MDAKEINGVLHWQHEDGRWIPYTQQQLSQMLIKVWAEFYKKTQSKHLPKMMQEQAS